MSCSTYLQLTVMAAILIAATRGYIVKDGNCSLVSSGIPVVTNFDMEKYLGKWYEIERYEQDFQRDLECVTVEYSRNEKDDTIEFRNKGFSTEKDAFASFSGTARIFDPLGKPPGGKLIVSYGVKSSNESNYWVVDTDYTRFSVVYSCMPMDDSETVSEGYWLLSRTPELTEELQITEKLKFLLNTYFIPSHVRTTNQTESLCRKEPEKRAVPATLVLPPF
ncbi:outer membrane lipoprotein Blc-like [Topomyia yanbarensis]|uniref:outer membrane lipoprotein Blc-like n=1 Tax=Topomyia yanbarensis TaxID=2498891 RepID=UPI00273B4AB7|nr:outer membrane lipoprotein Blc-like [Topomyia yanbarensis]